MARGFKWALIIATAMLALGAGLWWGLREPERPSGATLMALSLPAYHVSDAFALIQRLQPSPRGGRRRKASTSTKRGSA